MNHNEIDHQPPKSLATYLAQATQDFAYGQALSTFILLTANASVQLARTLAQSSLTGQVNKLDSINVQGEHQMHLDVVSNRIFMEAFEASKLVAGIVSEELAEMVLFNKTTEKKPFIVNFDPLDGSSNLAVNGVVGSIFSVLAAPDELDINACLQAGVRQLAAFYVLYGPATMLVITVGDGTQIFTLNHETNGFYLTSANVNIATKTSEFAINSSNARFWEKPVQRYIAECTQGSKGVRARDFNMRWTASMVADVHRILMRGGVFLYPKDSKQPSKNGRLRLLYEANPMSMLIEQAKGKSSTGHQRIMEIQPATIHERVPVILGSQQEVILLDLYHLTNEQETKADLS